MQKGMPDIYDKTCYDICGDYFYDWDTSNPQGLIPGLICCSYAIYIKSDRWYLSEHNYDKFDEANSTWYAKIFAGRFHDDNANIMKYFRLEAGEKLLTTNGKERPIVLIRPATDDWWNPPLSGTHEKYWLCLPLFSYKTRHNQDYVLRDQRLENDNSFFFPSIYSNRPAVAEESAVRFHAIQMIKERDIKPYKQYCSDPGVLMSKPIKLSNIGLRLLMYHFYKSLGIFSELNDPDAEYSLFKEQINILISAAIKK